MSCRMLHDLQSGQRPMPCAAAESGLVLQRGRVFSLGDSNFCCVLNIHGKLSACDTLL